jgi:hypothetical protein
MQELLLETANFNNFLHQWQPINPITDRISLTVSKPPFLQPVVASLAENV